MTNIATWARRTLFAMAVAGAGHSAWAQPEPPANVCIPRALLDRIGAYMAGQPWRDVAPIMADLVTVARNPAPCPAPAPPPATAPRAP